MRTINEKVSFDSNNSGGMLGGVSNGNDITLRYVVKPTSSIKKPIATINKDNSSNIISVQGRHDPCVGIRSVPVAQAMCALVIADLIMMQKRNY